MPKVQEKILRQEWQTPSLLFQKLNKVFRFDLDAAALSHNRRCAKYLGPDHKTAAKRDGLTARWDSSAAFCNPGFSSLAQWIPKAAVEVHAVRSTQYAVVITHVATGSKWWVDNRKKAAAIVFLTPRPQFIAPRGIKKSSNARDIAVWLFSRPHACVLKHTPHLYWDWEKADFPLTRLPNFEV